MKPIAHVLLFCCLYGASSLLPAAEPTGAGTKPSAVVPAKKKAPAKKQPHSLLSVDPYDVDGEGVDPLDLLEEEPDPNALDPYDIEGQTVVDPYDEKPVVREDKESPPAERWQWRVPKFFKDWKQAWNDRLTEPQPPVTINDIGRELGAGYVGVFGGSVVGLFGGFVIGSVYSELAGCRRCWLDIAVAGSIMGSSFLTSTGVYMFGNSENQLGSMKATILTSLVPVLLAEGLYSDAKRVRKSGFYLLTLPLFATLGYNMSRHYRKPGETPWIDNIFEDDTWVSIDPAEKILAFNFIKRF